MELHGGILMSSLLICLLLITLLPLASPVSLPNKLLIKNSKQTVSTIGATRVFVKAPKLKPPVGMIPQFAPTVKTSPARESLHLFTANYIANELDQALSKAAMDQTKTMVKNVCKKKSGVKDDLLKGMLKGDFPREKTLMCYLGCCATTMQVIIKKNVLNEKFVLKQIQVMLPDDLKGPIMKQVNGCKDKIKGEDACEMGWQMAKCAYEVEPSVFLFPT